MNQSSTPRILINAGPSREYFDDVRFLSNASSGRMGSAVAVAARDRGWDVHLALGPTALVPPDGVTLHRFESTLDMERIAQEVWPRVDAFVATAALCDYRPRQRLAGKRKKSTGDWQLDLVRNPDVLAGRGEHKGQRVLVGFALESDPTYGEARRKLMEKHLDLIILNSTENLGSGAGCFHWIAAAGARGSDPNSSDAARLENCSKEELGQRIVGFVADQWTR